MNSASTPVSGIGDKASDFMILDMISRALSNAEHPGTVGREVARELRELTGARTVLLMQCLHEFGGDGHVVVAVSPNRRRQLAESEDAQRLAESVHNLEKTIHLKMEGNDDEMHRILARNGIGDSIVAPLRVGPSNVGCLLLLDIPEDERGMSRVLHTLDMLSTTLALVFRNSLLYEQQEATIGERTRELTLSNEALRESEERYRTLFERSSDAIFLVDKRTGRYLEANRAAEQLTGRSVSDLKELTTRDVTPENATERFAVAASADGARDLGEVTYVRPDGTERVALLQTIPLNENIIFGLARDITERKSLEDQFHQAQKMEAVGQLAGGVAHDFNNLLQAILGYGEMALEASKGESIHEDLEQVMKAAKRATALVRQLLAFSRKQVLELEDLNLSEVVGDLAKMVQRVIGEHIAFTIHSDPGLKAIRADKGQIEQILMNLCVNARDAMPGGGTLTIDARNTELDEVFCEANSWAQPGRYVLLSVTDTGCGMDNETKLRIFEPFFTTKVLGKGTGLGLSTVFGIVRQHKGMVNVYSELGVGTTFRIYLPMIEGTQAAREETKAAPPSGGTETILVADDDDGVRGVAQRILEKAGYTVLTANDGEEAIRVFDKHADQIDLVLLDVVMPKVGGKAVAEHVRRERPDARTLFASGYSADAIHTKFLVDVGMQMIQKPYQQDALLRKVREMLDS